MAFFAREALWEWAHNQHLQPRLIPSSAPALLHSPAKPDLRGPRLFHLWYWLDSGVAQEAGPMEENRSGLGSGGGGLVVWLARQRVDGPEGK